MQLTDTISKKDHIGFYNDDVLDYSKVPEFLRFGIKETSQMARIARSSVRYDERIPVDLADRLEEIANIANQVAELFDGDVRKTALWFRTPNPLLGNVSPRDMLRMGRYRRLAKFVNEAEQAQ